MLLDFGFDRERSCLALKLSANDIDGAVEILTGDQSELAQLYEQVQKKEQEKQQSSASLMDAFFAGMGGAGSGAGIQGHVKPPIVRHELDCKMTIVVRADKKSGITGGGTSAKLVSLAVIKAYEKGRDFDPISLLQWETNAWTKVCLKGNSDKELRAIAKKAEEVGVNHYLLEHSVTLQRKVFADDPAHGEPAHEVKQDDEKVKEKETED